MTRFCSQQLQVQFPSGAARQAALPDWDAWKLQVQEAAIALQNCRCKKLQFALQFRPAASPTRLGTPVFAGARGRNCSAKTWPLLQLPLPPKGGNCKRGRREQEGSGYKSWRNPIADRWAA